MKPKKVLVVEDSKLLHRMYEMMLRPFAVEGVFHANDGHEALQRLAEHPDTDLVLLDINMPNMNGLEFLEKVKADAALAEVPVVIISTEGKNEDAQRGLEAGAVAYIKKPFDNEDFVRIINGL
jgi:CheY-like chemotaxis protein